MCARSSAESTTISLGVPKREGLHGPNGRAPGIPTGDAVDHAEGSTTDVSGRAPIGIAIS